MKLESHFKQSDNFPRWCTYIVQAKWNRRWRVSTQKHTCRVRPAGVLEETLMLAPDALDFAWVRTSTRTGFRSPARANSSTASVCVAEKRPVRRCLGSRAITAANCRWNPMSRSLSASSRTRTCRNWGIRNGFCCKCTCIWKFNEPQEPSLFQNSKTIATKVLGQKLSL